MKKQRDIHMDVVTGIMLIYMVFLHLHNSIGIASFTYYIYAFFFFMPWFFYKAGVFYKQKDISIELNSSIRRLILPFTYFTFYGVICQSIIMLHKGDNNWQHYTLTPIKEVLFAGCTTANQPLWFLFDLFIIKCIYNCIMVKTIKFNIKKFSFIAFIVSCSLLFAFEYLKLYNEFTSPIIYQYVWKPVNRLIPGLVFFSLGVCLQNKLHRNWITTIVCIAIYLLIVMLKPSFVGCISDELNEGGSYLLYVISAFAGLIIFDNVFSTLSRYYKFPILSKIGLYSMSLYVIHMPVLNLLHEFLTVDNYPLCLTINLLAMFVLLPIIIMCIYHLNQQYLFGEKVKK